MKETVVASETPKWCIKNNGRRRHNKNQDSNVIETRTNIYPTKITLVKSDEAVTGCLHVQKTFVYLTFNTETDQKITLC